MPTSSGELIARAAPAAAPRDAVAAAPNQYATYDEWLRRTRKAESQYWGSVGSQRLSEYAPGPSPACSAVYTSSPRRPRRRNNDHPVHYASEIHKHCVN